ncbi:MAG: AAA family ATPase [Desulfobacterales bacterium]|jgi:general secretion pathway protein A
MCLTHYNLKEKPFRTPPDPPFIWLGKNHKKALTVLENGVYRNDNFIFITGDAATGKTTLIHAFLEHLGEKAVAAKITIPIPEELDFLNLVANEFNINVKFSYNVDFLIHFRRFLNNCYSNNKKVLLIIDDAHRLDQELLTQIQFLSSIEKHYTKGLKIIFVGQDEFTHILAGEDHKDLRRRITINHRVAPLRKTEVGEYILHQLRVAGHEGNIFSQDAMDEIFSCSRGYPGLINNICDHALQTGCVNSVTTIDAKIIKECADRLGLTTEPIDDDIKEPETIEKSNKVKGKTERKSLGRKIRSILLLALAIIAFSFLNYHGKIRESIGNIKKKIVTEPGGSSKLTSLNIKQMGDTNEKIDSNVTRPTHGQSTLTENKRADHKTGPMPHVEKIELNTVQDRIEPGRYTVFLHYSRDKNKKLIEWLAVLLKKRGFSVAGMERFDYKNRDIRFFHKEDKSGALLLQKYLTDFITRHTNFKHTNIKIFNLSHKYPHAKKGTLELWVSF